MLLASGQLVLNRDCAHWPGNSNRSPRSKPIVSLWLSTFLIACAVAVLIFFIAGLLYLLRFERVDNSGAYSIPSDTGLLIPSVCVSNSRMCPFNSFQRT